MTSRIKNGMRHWTRRSCSPFILFVGVTLLVRLAWPDHEAISRAEIATGQHAVPPKDPEPEATEVSNIEATVAYCHDGDTCHLVTTPGKLWFNARLGGIDAPEVKKKRGKNKVGQEYGDQSRDFLQNEVMGKKVTIRQTDLDQYNRPVVEIFLEQRNINLELVRKGYAEAYRGKTKRLDTKAYIDAETIAKAEKLGIWSLKNYESPAAFRKTNR